MEKDNGWIEHKLVGDTLIRTEGGITAQCECGWRSTHFSSMSASAAFEDHKDVADARAALSEPGAKPWDEVKRDLAIED